MKRIHQLPSSVVTKIAAGEVIERPASVVKELLENAVDAGGTRMDVEVEQGGTELIRLVDNGCGILPDDLPLAFASHATSKLDNADDLFRIGTFGFRGEALASIGGVGQVVLQSRAEGESTGAQVTCHGGQLSPITPWNGSPGTRIEVRHLFFNTPVRRKFLRATGTEMGHVSEAFTRVALAHTDLHLSLRHNGKTVYDLPGGADVVPGERLRERIGVFFGRDVRDALYEVERSAGPVTLRGYIADPSCERGNAKTQYLFVNGRWVRDRTLGHAVQEAYRGLLMTGRYALAFLFIDLPPDLVDVNVHPTKCEVRFQNSQALHHLVFRTLRDRLGAENLTARLQVPNTLGQPYPVGGSTGPVTSAAPWSLSAPPLPEPALPFGPRPSTAAHSIGLSEMQDQTPTPRPAPAASQPADSGMSQPPRPDWPRAADLAEVNPSKVIQLYDAYLVVETPEGMLVIDQHALHERILFEQFKARLRSGPLESQRLLIPEPVEMSAEQAARLLEHRDALEALGLGVEDFGGSTVLLTSYPAALGRRQPAAVLKAVVDHLLAEDRLPTREALLNNLLSLMACHAAVRAGDRLGPEEMAALVEQRHLSQDTHHCPHGRPTALLFTRHELDRQFRRV